MIAVFFCLLLGFITQRPTALYAVIAAILCIQPTYDKSKQIGLHRILGTIMGSVFSFIALELAAVIPALPGFLVYHSFSFADARADLCMQCAAHQGFRRAKLRNLFRDRFPACGSTLDTLPYVFERMIETIIGVLIALPVNRFLSTPGRKTFLNRRKANKGLLFLSPARTMTTIAQGAAGMKENKYDDKSFLINTVKWTVR